MVEAGVMARTSRDILYILVSLLPHPMGFPARRVVRVITAALVSNLPFEVFLDGTTPNF